MNQIPKSRMRLPRAIACMVSGARTLEDIYEAGKAILRSPGTNKQVARKLVLLEIKSRLPGGTIARFLNGDFDPSKRTDIRDLASAVTVPAVMDEYFRAKDGAAQIKFYFSCIGKRLTKRDVQRIEEMKIPFRVFGKQSDDGFAIENKGDAPKMPSRPSPGRETDNNSTG